ncbi:hypothetical protein LJB42_002067 [Komagataella kurtzmanii]|nr:hypothetical protein LJB42_002067 [Komagataella kurtzmanii]
MSSVKYGTRKVDSEKHQQILKALLKDPANKHCADCKVASHPRWASWNLGVFICIKCSGVHRSMGTHISKVKSVDLDVWTEEQLRSMCKWGNAKGNAYWEASLPDNYIPNEGKMANFIRTKYEMKKWTASKELPDPASISVVKKTVVEPSPKPSSQTQISASTQQPTLVSRPEPKKSNSRSLLDLDFGSKSSSSTSILSQPPPQDSSRPDLKKSILSLYSTPTSSQTFSPTPPHASNSSQSFTQQLQPSPTTSQPVNSNALDSDLFKNVWS